MSARRILSGMRPTGRMHLGNYVGALENWVRLQNEGWQNFHMVADWHMLTTGYEDTATLQTDIHEMVLDWLAAGLDPQRSVVFVQSHVKQHAELFLLFSMLVGKGALERNPTLKEQLRDLHMEESTITYGHLGYPVLQAADILIYKANAVPVGADQVPHVELTREIARRFNYLYCKDRPAVFPEPDAMLTHFPRLRGLDGQRMSKSVGNTILLSDSPEEIARKCKDAYTDPLKIRANDPGHPEGCVVFEYHRKFNDAATRGRWQSKGQRPAAPAKPAPGQLDEFLAVEQVDAECRAGRIGCVWDKRYLANLLATALEPIRERRAELERDPDRIHDVIADGDRRAGAVAEATMEEVRAAMGLSSRAPVRR
jgi:tryptophanyl-tRNA synthetase